MPSFKLNQFIELFLMSRLCMVVMLLLLCFCAHVWVTNAVVLLLLHLGCCCCSLSNHCMNLHSTPTYMLQALQHTDERRNMLQTKFINRLYNAALQLSQTCGGN
jgi:uncharacterized membrane protein